MAEESDSNMVCCGPGTGRDRNEASGFGASTKIRLVEYFNNLYYFTLILVSLNFKLLQEFLLPSC